jgi:hypothetical protein
LENHQEEYYVRVEFFHKRDVISIGEKLKKIIFIEKKNLFTLINSLRLESLPKTLGILSFNSLIINACT